MPPIDVKNEMLRATRNGIIGERVIPETGKAIGYLVSISATERRWILYQDAYSIFSNTSRVDVDRSPLRLLQAWVVIPPAISISSGRRTV